MPYIKQAEREQIEVALDFLQHNLKKVYPDGIPPGTLNYVITRLILGSVEKINYTNINAVMGVLACVQAEVYRRVAAGYEDKKCAENGDVFSVQPKGVMMNEVGQATWDSWPVGARMAIESLERQLLEQRNAARTCLRDVWRTAAGIANAKDEVQK